MWSPLAREPSLTMSSALHSDKSDTEAKRLSDTDSSQASTQEASKEPAASSTDKRVKSANRQTAAVQVNGSENAAVVRRVPERHVVLTTPPGNSRRPLLPIPTSVPSLLLYLPFQPLSSAVGPFPPSVRVLSATLCGSSRGSETVPRSLGLDGWRLPNTMNYVFPCASHTAFQ